jgi:DNA-directed RNA polymerase subunit L
MPPLSDNMTPTDLTILNTLLDRILTDDPAALTYTIHPHITINITTLDTLSDTTRNYLRALRTVYERLGLSITYTHNSNPDSTPPIP